MLEIIKICVTSFINDPLGLMDQGNVTTLVQKIEKSLNSWNHLWTSPYQSLDLQFSGQKPFVPYIIVVRVEEIIDKANRVLKTLDWSKISDIYF